MARSDEDIVAAHLEDEAFIHHKDDIYDATVVACFCGVRLDLPDDKYMILHPGFLFLFCVVLFGVQLVLICGVAFELKQGDYLKYNDEALKQIQNHFDMVRVTDFTLMTVLQVVIFGELRQGLKMLCFSLSPTTWNYRPHLPEARHLQGSRAFRSAITLAPLAILVSLFKVVIAYLVSTVSVSIILACPGVTDAIFNSLALTFISDIDEQVWQLLSSASHLRVCDPFDRVKDFKFRLKPGANKSSRFLSEIWWRTVAVAGILAYVGIDQLTLLLNALLTGSLPSSRLLCAIFSAIGIEDYLGESSASSAGWGSNQLLENWEFCNSEQYRSKETSLFSTYLAVMKNHPKIWFGSVAVVLTFVALPPILIVVVSKTAEARQSRDSAASLTAVDGNFESDSEDDSEKSGSE